MLTRKHKGCAHTHTHTRAHTHIHSYQLKCQAVPHYLYGNFHSSYRDMIKDENAQHTRSRQRHHREGAEVEVRSTASPMFRVVCLSQVTTVRKVGDSHSHRLEAELAPAITPSGKLRPH